MIDQTSDSSDADRGYDFKRVVTWLANRADLILLLDPDKPGNCCLKPDVFDTWPLRGVQQIDVDPI
jgi:hypothetical protein